MNNFFRNSLAGLALAGTVEFATAAPAKADGAASTRNIFLGAAALVAGVAIESNVAHKRAVAGTVEGYTQDGGTVYQDGHIGYPNGQTYYPSNNGQQVSCNGQNCYVTGQYANTGYNNGRYYGNGAYNGNNGYYNNGNNGNGTWEGPQANRRR